MKLISLNIWGGRMQDNLLEFITSNQDTDIFCFQEVYRKAQNVHTQAEISPVLDIYSEIQTKLTNHIGYFRPHVDIFYGIGINR